MINVNCFEANDVGMAQLSMIDDLSVHILVNLGPPLHDTLVVLVGFDPNVSSEI